MPSGSVHKDKLARAKRKDGEGFIVVRGNMLDGVYEAVGTGDGSMFTSSDPMFQQTLKSSISCSGLGLHSGQTVTMVLKPAPADHGIVFKRTDIEDSDNIIPARFDAVTETRLCSTISNEAGASVATIEHVMSALSALGVDNLLIEIDGPEVPAMDGSSEPFAFLIDCAGVVELDAPRKVLRVLKAVTVSEGKSSITISPSDSFTIDMAIEFDSDAIGRQWRSMDVSPTQFRSDIAKARTFGFRHEVEAMQEAGFGLGGSLENAVIVDGNGVMNKEGLRYDDEFVRHKILDCIGDLALAGLPIKGRIEAERTGHALNNKLLRALLADRDNWEIVAVDASQMQPAFLSAAE